MHFSATDETERFLREQVAAGVYASSDEAINEAVRLLQRRERIRRQIGEGLADLEAGRFVELDDAGLDALFDRLQETAET